MQNTVAIRDLDNFKDRSNSDDKGDFVRDLIIENAGKVERNLSASQLLEISLEKNEGRLSSSGALVCTTGVFTGRSPKDKFIVRDDLTENEVDWGSVNQPISNEDFQRLKKDQTEYLKGKNLFVRDAFAGADTRYQLPITVINESAWANLFANNLFIRPTEAELEDHNSKFTIVHTPGFSANPEIHGTKSETFIVVNFKEGLVLIGGTHYAGEMKKSIFSVLNFLYPLDGVLPMHCSANVDKQSGDNLALFFGLSGTGKTTLSADPERSLIGDDEHGWTDSGVFNFEGGCYAKCINLTEEKEPEIWRAIRNGAILENVVVAEDGTPDYDDGSLTENTRAAYPLEHIDGVVESGCGPNPNNIIFLTCDAFGVMPPISKLTTEQAMYHFLSGYTAKVAGTERGAGSSPQATFSAWFWRAVPTDEASEICKNARRDDEHSWLDMLVSEYWLGRRWLWCWQ